MTTFAIICPICRQTIIARHESAPLAHKVYRMKLSEHLRVCPTPAQMGDVR